MKLWHFAALVAVLGIAYVLISRPSITTVPVSTSASNATGLLNLGTSLAKLGTTIFSTSKAVPPSTVDVGTNAGTYYTGGDTTVDGNTLTGEQGQTLTYGTD